MRNFLRVLAASGVAVCSWSVQAANKTATFVVSLTVASDCSITTNALPFGTATSALATSPINQTTTLAVTCSQGAPYTLSLDKGTTSGSTVLARLLAGTGSNTQTVQYQLYRDAGRTTIWGDASGGTTVSGTGSGAAQSITIYGQIPAQAIPASDNYSSTETATIAF